MEGVRHYPVSEMRDNAMALHLVGETIDAKRAYLRAHAGKLLQLIG